MFNLIFFSALFLIIIISALVGFFRGFVKSVAGFLVYIVSFFAARTFTPLLAVVMKRLPFIAKMITDIEMPVLDNSSTTLQKIIEMVKYIYNSGKSTDEAIKQIANNYLAEVLSYVIAFIILFIAIFIILKLVVLLIHKIAQTPVLKQINKILGLLVGILTGFFITWLISNAFTNIILPILSSSYPDVIPYSIGQTSLMKFFMESNPISWIMNFIVK